MFANKPDFIFYSTAYLWELCEKHLQSVEIYLPLVVEVAAHFGQGLLVHGPDGGQSILSNMQVR